MEDGVVQTEVAIGRYLAKLRDDAGLTQADLAKKITASAARISRIESGDVVLTDEEMAQFLNSIGTASATAFRQYLRDDWDMLERPPFDHPDRETLWTANGILRKVRDLKANPELKSVFVRQIEMYEADLRALAADLRSTDHNLAFIGSIGVGKTSAICTMTDLRTDTDGPFNRQMVLEAGAGGTTICEVHIKTGPAYGLIIEPRTEDAIKYDVADFAEYLLRVTKGGQRAAPATGGPEQDGGDDGPGMTKEVIRAIRNMARLTETKTKDASGALVRSDPARELAGRYPDPKELAVQIRSLMDLPRRERRDIWYPVGSSVPPLAWLQQTFAAINNGRHPDFSLPQRIEVVVPRPVLADAAGDVQNLNVRILDTKGIDQAATRADLDRQFDDSRTITVLCSRFMDAPEQSLQNLLQRVKNAAVRDIIDKTVILVLARQEEAVAMKHDDGMQVDSEEEGYDLKRDQVVMRLTQLGLNGIPVEFFNARYDDFGPSRRSLVGRVRRLRGLWAQRVDALGTRIDALIANHETEQAALVYREVMNRVNTWLAKNRSIDGVADQAQQELVRAIRQAHPQSIRASVRRKGEWYNLDYYHQLGYGARTIAAKHVMRKVEQFEVILQNLIDDDGLSPAHGLLEQVKGLLRSKAEELFRRIQIAGKDAFEEDLKADAAFWKQLEDEWGAGYRDSIARDSGQWFEAEDRKGQHAFVRDQIVAGWNEILSELDALFVAIPA